MLDPDFLADPFHGKGVLVNATPDKRVWNWFDEENRRWVSCTVYRVDPILDQNAEDQVDNLNRKWGDGAVAARIPLPLYFEKIAPLRRQGEDGDKAIRKILNDSDYSKLRTRSGRI